MEKGRKISRNEIIFLAESAVGYSINELAEKELITIDKNKLKNKGGVGQIIESLLFGIDNNSESEPDFMPAHIELKVTPYKQIRGGKLSAKERLVLNIINYEEEYKNTFDSSHFYFKNKTIQLMWYLWEPDKDSKDYKITHQMIMELDDNPDLDQIKKDWQLIVDKIKAGKAHELSEADTMYLGACTKGADSKSLRTQPNSSIKAMQRAFCFKNSYMTQLVRKYIGDYSNVEKLLADTKLSFDDYIKNITNKYIGMTDKELMSVFEIKSKSKDIYSRIVNHMFNVKRGLDRTDEFTKANIISKTIRVEENGSIRENISFPAFSFKELINQTWEESELKEQLETTKYMFFIFRKKGKNYVFDGYKLWNMSQIVIDNEIKKFWLDTVNTIKDGVKFVVKNNEVENNLPSTKHNGIMHVRPHANKAAYKLNDGFIKGDIERDADQLPNGEWMTKQAFWFNRNYIEQIVGDGENE